MIESFIVLGATALLFFLLRGWMLWYWKVDKIIENQNTTNTLLRAILMDMEDERDRNRIEQPKPKEL